MYWQHCYTTHHHWAVLEVELFTVYLLHWQLQVVSKCRLRKTAWLPWYPMENHRLVGLVVKVSASRAEDPGFESRLCRDFFRVKSYQWLKNWHSSGYPARRLATGQPGVSILWLGEIEHLVCNFYLTVAARKLVWADPSLKYTRMLLGR